MSQPIKIKARMRKFVPLPSDTVKVNGTAIPALGMGTLPLGTTYAPGGRPDPEAALKLIKEALRLGVRFFDTADTYGEGPDDSHYVEKLLGQAVKEAGLESEVVIATKTGMKRVNKSKNGWRPRVFKSKEELQDAIMASYHALGDQTIKLWWFHHTDGYDTKDPTEFQQACQAVKELVDKGIIQSVGLCNCSTAHIDIARSILPIVAVQNSFSLYDQAAARKRFRKGPVAKSNKNEILEYCKTHGLFFCPHGALGGTQSRDGRRNLAEDYPKVKELAIRKRVSPQVLVLAWMRHKYPHILHIFGTRTVEHLRDIIQNVPKVRFTQPELDSIA